MMTSRDGFVNHIFWENMVSSPERRVGTRRFSVVPEGTNTKAAISVYFLGKYTERNAGCRIHTIKYSSEYKVLLALFCRIGSPEVSDGAAGAAKMRRKCLGVNGFIVLSL